jgi:iron-sulfur cluster insertion protein
MHIEKADTPFTITEHAALKLWEFIQEEREFTLSKFKLFLKAIDAQRGTIHPLSFKWCLWLLEEMNLKLKISILGGGCHGFRYNFSFTHHIQPGDTVITQSFQRPNHVTSSVECLIDVISLQFLRGGELHYQSDLQGEQFIIRNLKAKTTCGCGASFGI